MTSQIHQDFKRHDQFPPKNLETDKSNLLFLPLSEPKSLYQTASLLVRNKRHAVDKTSKILRNFKRQPSYDFPMSLIKDTACTSNSYILLANWLGIEGKAAEDGGRRTFDDFPHQGNLSPALIQYFSSGTNAILSDSIELNKVGFVVSV